MLPPRNRTDLIRMIQAHVNHPAAQRAFVTGTVEVLGMFPSLPPDGRHGWVIELTSKHGKRWRYSLSYGAKLEHDYVVRRANNVDLSQGSLGEVYG